MINVPVRHKPKVRDFVSMPTAALATVQALPLLALKTDMPIVSCAAGAVAIGGAAGFIVRTGQIAFINSNYWKNVKALTYARRNSLSGEEFVPHAFEDGKKIPLKSYSEMLNAIDMPPYPEEIFRASAELLAKKTRRFFSSAKLVLHSSASRAKTLVGLTVGSAALTAVSITADQGKIVAGISLLSTIAGVKLTSTEVARLESNNFSAYVNGFNSGATNTQNPGPQFPGLN